MTDQDSQYFAILTAIGEAKLANAIALGTTLTFAQMAVGDANETKPIPNRLQTKLINERRRAPLNQVKPDPKNPGVIIAEQVIPESVGGWWVHELALYDADGDMVAVANCAPTYKPLLSQGSGRTQVIRINLVVSSTANIELKIDPSVVLATREYVDRSIVEAINKQDYKASMLVATTAPIALNGLQTIDGVAVTAGARVLVKNQAQAKENGAWLAAAGAWSRTLDADENPEVTPGMVLMVEMGTTQSDTLWQLVTDAPITVGVTPLTFRNITEGFARIDSPAFIGTPRAPTPDQFDSSTKVATTEALWRASGSYRGQYAVDRSFTLSALHVGQIGRVIGDGGYSVTLPPTAGIPAGPVIRILNASLASITVISYGVPISGATLTPEGTVILPKNGSIELYWNSAAWVVFAGTEAIRFAGFAALASPDFTGMPTAPTASAGTNSYQLANTAFVWKAVNAYATTVTAALAALDPWALVPVGVLVPLMDNSTVPAPSRSSTAYKYIRLTASDGYNSPILVSESITGTAPLVIATGVVSLADSPLNGVRINLINTERRVLRAGLPGVVEQDALQNITGSFGGGEASPSTIGAFSNGAQFGTVGPGGSNRNVINFDASLVARTSSETRVKSMGVTYYLRVK